MVRDGRRNVVGTKRPEVTRAIEEATAAAPIVDVTLDDAGGGRARLTAGTAPAEAATVWLITFDDDHDTTIARGENGGRALHNSNVVRALSTLATRAGEAVTFPLHFSAATAAGPGGVAVVAQHGRGGPGRAAAT